MTNFNGVSEHQIGTQEEFVRFANAEGEHVIPGQEYDPKKIIFVGMTEQIKGNIASQEDFDKFAKKPETADPNEFIPKGNYPEPTIKD